MTITTKAQRRLAHEQALASTRIEGHRPSPEFLADCEAVVEGAMTRDQARAASLARAMAGLQEGLQAQPRLSPPG
jgi:hypothetical protein